MFSNIKINKEIDNKRSRAEYKTALKSFINETITDEVVESVISTFNRYNSTLAEVYLEIVDALGFEPKVDMEKPNASKDVLTRDWDEYNLNTQGLYVQVAIEATKPDIVTKKSVKHLLKVVIDKFASNKKDEIIFNSLLPQVGNVFKCGAELAAVYLEVLNTTALVTRKLVTNKDTDKKEHMFSLHLDLAELQSVYFQTSDRFVKFSTIDSVEGKNICSRKKYNYQQEMVGEAAESLDYINNQSLSFSEDFGEKEIVTHVKKKLFGDAWETSELSEPWQRRALQDAINEYKLIKELGNKFSTDHSTDGVGRMYDKSNNYGVQQGSYLRQYLEFSHKEKLTQQGKREVELAIACHNGYDKSTEEEAREGYKLYQDDWRQLDDRENQRLFSILDSGEATGLMVEQDAQTQGVSLFALGRGSMTGCVMTGIVGDDIRTDYYGLLSSQLNSRLNTNVWDRASVKYPFMTVGYSAKWKTIMYGSKADEEFLAAEVRGKVIPLMATSDASEEDTWNAFQKTMYHIAPFMMNTMKKIEELAKKGTQQVIEWTMPDGIKAQVAMQETKEETIKWVDINGKLHQAKNHKRVLNAKAGVTAWAPRIIQSIDAYAVRYVARKMEDINAPFVAVHDGYITHPNYVQDMRDFYKEALVDIHERDLLLNIIHELTGVKYSVKKEVTSEDIMGGKYAIWY